MILILLFSEVFPNYATCCYCTLAVHNIILNRNQHQNKCAILHLPIFFATFFCIQLLFLSVGNIYGIIHVLLLNLGEN